MSSKRIVNQAFLDKFKDKIQKMNRAGDLFFKSSSSEDKKTAANSIKSGREKSRNYYRIFQKSEQSTTITSSFVQKKPKENKKRSHDEKLEISTKIEPRRESNQPLSFLSLPKISKNDILQKAKNLRLKVGQSMNISSMDFQEVTGSPKDAQRGQGVIEMRLKLRYLKDSKKSQSKLSSDSSLNPKTGRTKYTNSILRRERKKIESSPQKTQRGVLERGNKKKGLLPNLRRANLKTYLNGFETFGKLVTPTGKKMKLIKSKNLTKRANSLNRSALRTPRFEPYDPSKDEGSPISRSISDCNVNMVSMPANISNKSRKKRLVIGLKK
ncbi:unnamed protein product [Moneuplotes crassus]|uniref:Uncharacterized protein n=1 Tax=Euplotes crassus TaxID=5936 RepID=A0AAD1U6I3_EUPCR|nr:unnamed protein product [Moneuplotes crassus]